MEKWDQQEQMEIRNREKNTNTLAKNCCHGWASNLIPNFLKHDDYYYYYYLLPLLTVMS